MHIRGASPIHWGGVLFMSDTYPIILSGEEKGTLTVSPRGLTTEFIGRCPDPGRLVRLSVYGNETEGYLGVMEPVGGALYLCRRLSRAAMAGFPQKIEYAGESGAAHMPAPPPAEPAVQARGRNTPRRKDLVWHSAPDGSLYTTVNGKGYRAIPMAAWGLPMERAVERRTIQGVEYAVFALEEGQIV